MHMQIKSASPFDVKIIAVTEVWGFDEDSGADIRINILDQKEWDASNLSDKDLNASKCDCCGHKIKYSVIAKHIPTNTIASLGRKCASNIEALKKCGSLIDGASIALSQRILCENREQEFRKLLWIQDPKPKNYQLKRQKFGRPLYPDDLRKLIQM